MLCAELDFAEFDTAVAGNGFAATDRGRGYTRLVSYSEIEALLESAGYSAEETDYDWGGAENPAVGEAAEDPPRFASEPGFYIE